MQENNSNEKKHKKDYVFGEIKEYDLSKIEEEVLKESVYLDVFAGSDIAFKENCSMLNPEVIHNKLSLINTYSFNYKIAEFPEHDFASGDQIGFMAQEIESVFPELVKKDSNGNRLVNYTQVIPLLLQSIKHLSKNMEKLEKRLDEIGNN